MKRPDWIYKSSWDRLTDRQRKTMLAKGPAHLNHMLAWLRASKNPRGDQQRASKRESMPRESQWYNERESEKSRPPLDHQY